MCTMAKRPFCNEGLLLIYPGNADDRGTNYGPNSSSSFPTATAWRCLLTTKVFSKCPLLLLHISGRGNSQESSQDLLLSPPPLFFATLLLHECANSGLSSARGGEGRLSATKATGEGPRLLFSTPQTHEEEEAGRANNTMNSPLSLLTSWRNGGGSYSQTSQGRNRLKPLLLTVVSSTPESSSTYH